MRTDIEKRKRQDLIKEIIRQKPIATQEELVAEIRSQNLMVTQTTVSRDLVELEVGKWNGKYHIPYSDTETPAWFETIRQQVIAVKKISDHMLVLKTKPGASVIVEKALNDYIIPEIAGVVGSSQTVMIAFESSTDQQKILEMLHKAIA